MDTENKVDGASQQVDQSQLRQLGQENTQEQAACHGNGKGDDILPGDDTNQIPLAHTQHIVKTKFTGTAAKQE